MISKASTRDNFDEATHQIFVTCSNILKTKIGILQAKKCLLKAIEQTNTQIFEILEFQDMKNKSNLMTYDLPYLPSASDSRYTLVLDLDETLIHYKDSEKSLLLIRPGAKEFLKSMSEFFEIVVFTAGMKDYADWVLNILDPEGLISHRLYRDHCTFKQGYLLKDLSLLGRDLSRILIVDNIEDNF